MKCSKRGNDVYAWRLKQRLENLERLCDAFENVKLFGNEGDKVSVLFITLTYDTKKKTPKEAWQDVGEDWNNFHSALERKYGKVHEFRVWESTAKGYPHIHAVLMFEEANKFTTFRYNGIWRIQEKHDLEQYHHSNIDVEPVQTVGGIKYLLKYLTKVHEKDRDEKRDLTLGMMWLFRKRAYGISEGFVQGLENMIADSFYNTQGKISYRLDHLKHNSNQKMLQITLEGEIITELPWTFVGIFSKDFVVRWSDSKESSWYHVLDEKCSKDLEQIIHERSMKRY